MSIAISPLTSFGCIKVSGQDVHNFMQGQVTCDVNLVNESKMSITAYCNDKGRISASGYLYKENDAFYFLTPKTLIANTQQKFKQYGIFSNICTENVTDIHIIACLGTPKKINLPKNKYEITEVSPGVKATCLDKEAQQYIFFGKQEETVKFQEELAATKGIDLTLDLYKWEQTNIDCGIVHIYPETLDKLTPHMANYHLNGAISFTKGCFLGQEIIARTQHRGRSKRKLYLATVLECTTVKIGDIVTTDCGEQAGLITARSSSDNNTNILVVLSDHTIKSKLRVGSACVSKPELLLAVAEPA
jgi:folate-binding protein YgfZ